MKKIFTLLFATLMTMSMFAQKEYTVAWVNAPVDGKPASVDIVGSFSEEGTAVELLDNGWFIIKVEATQDDIFKLCDASNKNMVLCQKVNDQWVQAVFKFGDVWETSSYKGTPCKSFELDLSDAQKYAWKENMPDISSIKNLTTKTNAKVVKMMRNGKVLIVRGGKTYNVMGTEVR